MKSMDEISAFMSAVAQLGGVLPTPYKALERRSELSQGIGRYLAQLMQSGYEGEVPFGLLDLRRKVDGQIYRVPHFRITDGKLYGLLVPTKGFFRNRRAKWTEVNYAQMPPLEGYPLQDLETLIEKMEEILPNSSI